MGRPRAGSGRLSSCSLLRARAAARRCHAEPAVRVAGPAPAQFRGVLADPQRGDAAITAPRAAEREALVGGEHVRELCDEGDALLDRERGAVAFGDGRQCLLGNGPAELLAPFEVEDDMGEAGGRYAEAFERG